MIWRLPVTRRLAGLLAATLTVASCSAVPSTSNPQIVRTLQLKAPSASVAPPDVKATARDIVLGFLSHNADRDPFHLAAQEFLTKSAAAAWQPSSSAVILNKDAPSLPEGRSQAVTLRGTEVGTLSGGGAFSLPSGDPAVQLTFHFDKTSAGYRIKDPPPGLVLGADDFTNDYALIPLYFFNANQTTLVPDLRYTSAKQQALADWLLAQFLAGPAPGGNLANLVPTQIDPKNAKVTLGQPIVFQLPGFKNVASATRTRIAAELAYTFRTTDFAGRALEIQDGTATVPIVAGQNTFSVSTLPARYAPINSAPKASVYYVRSGRVFDAAGHQATDTVSGQGTGFRSVAVASAGGAIQLVATVASNGKSISVDSSGQARPVALPDVAQSRPEWSRDGTQEVWVGVGGGIKRVRGNGTVGDVPIQAPQGSPPIAPRAVTAIRFSPDGARVALVLADVGSGKSSSAWLGNVVRSGNAVTVQGLHQFTPTTWYVRDLTWTDATNLEVIDNLTGSFEFSVYAVRSDGSNAQAIESANQDLPGPPRYIAAGPGNTTWVSVGSGPSETLWRQTGGGQWVAPFGASQYLGSAPVYST